MAEWWQENSTPIKTEDFSQVDKEEDAWWKTNATPVETPEPPRPDYDLGDLAGKAIKRGFKRTGSTLFDTLPALGLAALGFDEAAERQLEEARATEEAIQRDLPAQFESFRDVDWKNPLDIGKFVIEKVGEQSANLLTVLVPGAGGAAAGSKVAADRALKTLIEKKASKKARDRILKSARAKGANIGQVGGVFLGSYSLNAPETFRGIYDQTGNLEVGASLIAGTVNASLDSIFPITLMRSFSPAGRAGIVTKILERSGMNPGLARSAVTKVLGSAAIEGVTEATQEAVNITAENFVQEHSFAFDSDDYERMLEGGITGAAAGGGFRVVGESVQSVKKGIDEYIKEKADAGPPVGSIPSERKAATPTITETETQKKVRLAQELNDRQRAERIAGELEQFEKDAIQAEYQEKLNTAEGVNDIIDNFDRYFAGKSKKEKNQIRTKLQQRRADLEAGDPVEESTVEVEPKKEEPKAATKRQTKEQSKEEIEQALEQQVLDFVTQQSILGKKVTKNQLVKSKDFNIGPKRAGEILKRLRSDFKIQGDKGKGNQIEYASLDFVPLPKKKKDYAGIKKADPRAVPLKVGQRSKKEGLFSGPASTSINHMLNLAGVLGVNATNMDVNLQKRLIQEFNKASQNLISEANTLKEDIKFQRSIDNEYFTQIFSQKSIDALKEYAEETRNDYNTRQRIAGATRASDQTGVAGGTGAPILSPKKTTTEVVEETDRTPVAAVGPDTGQLTGAERRVDPALKTNDRGIILNDEGKPKVFYHGTSKSFEEFKTPEEGLLGVQAVFASESSDLAATFIGAKYSMPPPITGDFRLIPVNVRAKNLFDFRNKEHIDKVAKIIEKQDFSTVQGPVVRGEDIIFMSPLEEFKESQIDGDFSKIEPHLNEIQEAGFDAFLVREIPADSVSLNVGVFDPSQLVSTSEVRTTPQPKEKNLKTSNVEQSKTEFKPSEDPQLTNGRDKKDLAPSEKGDFELSGGQQEGIITNPVEKQKKFDKINYAKGMQFTVLPQTLENTYGKKTLSNIRIVERATNWAGAHHNGGIALQGLWPYAVPVGPNVVAHELGHAAHSLLGKKINNNMQVFNDLKNIEEFLYPDLRTTVENTIAEGKKLSNNDIEFFNYLLSPEELIAEFNVLRMADPSTAKAVAPLIVEQFESVDKAPNLVKVRKTFPTGFGSIVAKAPKAFDNNYTKLHAAMGRAAGVSLEELRLGTKEDREKLKTTRKGDPRDKEIINKLKSKRTLGQVLAILDKEKITTTQKELVTVLLSLPNIKSVKFNIVKDSDLEPGTFGEYDVKNNFIKVGFSGDVQAVLHEATHAATANQLTKHISRDGKGKTPVGRKLIALYNTTVDTLASRDFIQSETFSRDFAAELENIDEFVAGAFNNPAFQEILAQIESPTSDAGAVATLRAEAADPKGKDATRREIDRMEAAFRGPPLEETIDSAWAGFVKAVKQIINPNFKLNLRDSVLNDVIALAPELFVGPNPAEQAQGPQGRLFIKDKDKAKTISELDVKSLEELEVLPEIRSYTIPEMNETLSTDISDAEADIALENIDNLNRQAAGTNIVTPLEKELDVRYDINAGKDAFLINGHAAPLKYNEPGVILRNYNKLMDILNSRPIASEGIGKSIVDTLSNLPAAIARAFVGFLSLPQIFELIGNRIPALKPLYGLLENKAIITKNGREDIGFVIQFVENITDKYKETPQGQAILKRWNRVLLRLSAEDVDPEAALAEDVDLVELTETNPTAAALVREYDQLPQDLKDAANRMVNDLRQRYEQLLAATIEAYPDREAKIRRDFAMKPYYLPLVRKGDYWYKYIDSETGRQAYSSAGSESSRRLEMQRIIDEGIGTEVQISTRVESARLSGAPPSAFVEQLKDSINDLELPTGLSAKDIDKIKKTFVQDIEENYLQLFPAQSLQNSQRHRKAVPGYIEDVVLAYADGAPKISNSYGNTLFNRQILSAINSVQQQAAVPENQNNALVQAAAKSILNRSSFFVNPVAQGYAALAAFGSFYWFLGLNPSSALINLTQLPLVVQPFLAAEYGGIVDGQLNSLKALNDARKLYTTGGVEQTRKKDFLGKQFLPDMTMAPFKVDLKTGNKIYVGKNKNLFKPGGLYADLFKKAEESATIRRGISYEATEISRQPNRDVELTKPNRIGAKVNSLVGYLFQNSERFNREITLVAAYNLEMEKLLGKNWKTRNKTTPEYRRANNQAVAKAIDLTVRAHSHALPEVGPEYFQDGPMKVMTIFKRFAQQQIYLTSRLLLLALPRQIVKEKDNANMTAQEKEAYKNERKLAISRLMGIYAYSWILAGVQGMPFYGLAYLLYELVADDEDEPANLDTKLMQDLGNTVYRGPFNKALGIDISRRTGFRDMVFRTDEQRLEEVGFFTYSIETILGPAYSAGQRFAEGGTELFTQGLSIRSLEKMLPTALSNSLKAVRQSTDGITNVRGVSITDDPNLYQSIMQVMGFTSLEVSEAYARANAIKGPERKLYKRRSRLLLEYWLALRSGDSDAVQEVKDEILEYNTVVSPSFRISNDTIRRSMKNRRKIEMRAIDGVDVKNRSELELIYGIDED